MGKIVTVEYVDDLDGVPIDPDVVDTVEFSYRGKEYSLVLSPVNSAQFDKDIARYITAAKKAATRDARAVRKKGRPEPRQAAKPERKSQTRRKVGGARKSTAAVSGPERSRAIREWAVANGHKVSKRGRIAAPIVEAYDAAQ